ncbi:MAG: hypothetical protein K9W44_08495 [Candidatus Lokiarchaeota archaeon]|nr:hypothetical protein [Candidatus Harpocratesius repetitus]
MNSYNFRIFNTKGEINLIPTLQNAYQNAVALNISTVLIASTTGMTISKAVEIFPLSDFKLICVTHNFGFSEKENQAFPTELKKELKEKGIQFITGTLAFSGVSSALIRKYQHYDSTAIFSRLIRTIIGDGVKVAMEMALMAVDAGLVKMGQEIITVSGTGHGADTCCWIKSASSRMIDSLRVNAIFAKPK